MNRPLSKHWLTKEEYMRLDREARSRYTAEGGEYLLKPGLEELRHERLALFVLGALAVIFALIGGYGILYDHWTLEIVGFCGAMPTLFGFLVHLAMHFSESPD